jgi:hypothetical protein
VLSAEVNAELLTLSLVFNTLLDSNLPIHFSIQHSALPE